MTSTHYPGTSSPNQIPHQVLALLGIHPDHRGKGKAGQLVRWAFPLADRKGVTYYVDSSAAGLPVCKKCGFGEVDLISFDLEKYEGVTRIRKPSPTALLKKLREL